MAGNGEDVQMVRLVEPTKNGAGKPSATNGKAAKKDKGAAKEEVMLTVQQPKAPDGGWGWVVVIGAFFCNFIVDGIMFSFDIMRTAFTEEFPDVKEYEIQIMGSLIPGLYMALAPFSSVFLNLFGPRPLVMVGGVMGMFAFLTSAFVTNFYVLMMLYGVVGGVAFTLIYSPSIIAVGFYFDKKRATATGITVCGSCVGTFALGSMMHFLNSYYGSWRGVLIICAGVVFNCVVFGALFRPLANVVVEQITVVQEEDGVDAGNGATQTGDDQEQFIIQKIVEEKRRRKISQGSLDNCVITSDNRIVKVDGQQGDRLSPEKQLKRDDSMGSSHSITKVTVQQVSLGSGAMYRQDALYPGNVQSTKEYHDAEAVAAATGENPDEVYTRSVTHIPPDDAAPAPKQKKSLINSKAIRDALNTTFDMSLLTSFTFWLLCIAAFLGMLGFFTPFFFGKSYAEHNGMTPFQGLWVINCVAIANAVGRVLCGILSDQPWADSLFITNVAMCLSGACNIIIPPFAHYGPIAFYIYAISFGLSIAPYISLRSIIVVDLLGIEKLTSSYGFLLLFMGLAAFVGGPVLVGIKTYTGFDNVFYISGVVLSLSGIICFPCRRIAKWEKARLERKKKEANGGHEMSPVNA